MYDSLFSYAHTRKGERGIEWAAFEGYMNGIYPLNMHIHRQSLIWVMIPIESEYILLYVNVFMPSKKSGCIDLLISLRFPCVCMYVYAYACVNMQCGEYEGTQTIVRLIY